MAAPRAPAPVPGVPAPVALAANALDIANGAIFIVNQAGEAEDYHQYERVIYGNDVAGHDNNQVFSPDLDRFDVDGTPPIAFNAANATRFMADNAVWVRHICGINEQRLPIPKLAELVYIRYLMVKNKLAAAGTDPTNYHCTINNIEVHKSANLPLATVRGWANYGLLQTQVMNEINGNPDHYTKIRVNFATIVCCVAKMFRAKGHHFISDSTDEEDYTHLFKKALRTNWTLNSEWMWISTLGLHAILPQVLDKFWLRCAARKEIPEALIIRVNVAAAGTAAVLALEKGWMDAKTCYGPLLSGHEATYADLLAIADTIRNNRWTHGINARYYGANTARLDLARMCAMAATIQGVYEATAQDATLLGSKSMAREAKGAPIQKDLALASAKQLRKLLVKSLQTEVERGNITLIRQ